MDNNSQAINLPFWETIRRSFLYVLTNLDIYLKVSALGFAILIYELFTGFPSLCNISAGGCVGSWEQNVSILLLSLISIAIIIAFCRVIILKTSTNYFTLAFGKREILYLLYSLFMVAIITLPSILLVFTYAYVAQLLHLPEFMFNFSILIPFLLTIYFSRIFLVFPAVAVDNYSLGIKGSFKLTLGNANKIFWGQFLMMIPAALMLVLVSLLYKAIGVNHYVVDFIFVALVLALSFLDSCFKASFYAHIYQYFIYFQEQSKTLKNK